MAVPADGISGPVMAKVLLVHEDGRKRPREIAISRSFAAPRLRAENRKREKRRLRPGASAGAARGMNLETRLIPV